MPNQPKTPNRALRMPDDTYRPAVTLAAQQGTSVSALCRDFLDWYLRKPGAKLPHRPERTTT